MKILEGKSVFPGIAIGKIQVWMEEWDQVKRVHVPDRNQELRRLDEAKEKAIVELKELHQKAEIEAGSSEAEIFEVHQMMLDEGEYIESIRNRIRTESVNAEYAATAAGEYFADMFRKMDNEYIKERAADILDITSTMEELGKPVFSDEKNHKVTYVTLRGLEQAKKDVETISEEAVNMLEEFPQKNTFLQELVRYLVNRKK